MLRDIGLFLHQYLTQKALFPYFLAIALVTGLLVSPVGDFPLNDDWIFAKAVERLLQHGYYRGHEYLNATFVAQAYWGALFCKVFGFSFTTLRVSTLVLWTLTAWSASLCALSLGLSRALALGFGALVQTNAIVLSLSYSFMTDIPFLFATTFSGFFFLQAFTTQRPRDLFWANLWAGGAFLVRQFGILLPMAFWLAQWSGHRRNSQRATSNSFRFSWALLAIIIPWLMVAGIMLWLKHVSMPSSSMFYPIGDRWLVMTFFGLRHPFVSMIYLGLFLLPFFLAKVWQWATGDHYAAFPRKLFWGFGGLTLGACWFPTLLFWLNTQLGDPNATWLKEIFPPRLPMLGPASIIQDLSLGGPILLADVNAIPPTQIQGGWWPITAIALLAGSGVITVVLTEFWQNHQHVSIIPSHENSEPAINQDRWLFNNRATQVRFLFYWGSLFLMAAYNPFRITVVDRYLITTLIPFGLIIAKDLAKRPYRKALQVSLLTGVCLYLMTLISLQTWMAWNQTALTAYNRLLQVYHASPAQINGVEPLNGWYNSDAYMQKFQTRDWAEQNLSGLGNWVLGDTYRITGQPPPPGYEIIEKFRYFSWLSFRHYFIYSSKRIPAPPLVDSQIPSSGILNQYPFSTQLCESQ
jgi:hypothetical protein